MKKPIFIISIIFSIIVVLTIVRVGVENNVSTTGVELVKLEESLSSYRKANAILKERYLKEASLIEVSKKASSSGFVDAKSHVYLTEPLPIALGR